MDPIADIHQEFTCPTCGRKTKARLEDFKDGRTVRCGAGHKIILEEEGSGLRQADKAFQDFDDILRKLG